jgi:hypothetical protein
MKNQPKPAVSAKEPTDEVQIKTPTLKESLSFPVGIGASIGGLAPPLSELPP